MVNEYSFGLDVPQDTYLSHGKLGAHYSKNWTKEKQNAYNKWYYEHNKDKWKDVNDEKLRQAKANKREMAEAQHDYEEYTWYANALKKNADAYELAKTNSYERRNMAGRLNDGETYNSHIKNLRDHQKASENIVRDAKNKMNTLSNPKTAGYTSSSNKRIKNNVSNIQSDRDKLSNKVRYDVETTAAKAAKAVKNIANSIKAVKNTAISNEITVSDYVTGEKKFSYTKRRRADGSVYYEEN